MYIQQSGSAAGTRPKVKKQSKIKLKREDAVDCKGSQTVSVVHKSSYTGSISPSLSPVYSLTKRDLTPCAILNLRC